MNLGLTNCRVKDGASSCRHGIGGKTESQEGAGGTGKRRRETGKRKTTASKWKLWEEEESKKSVGSMLSREERKAMAVSFPLSLFLALSSPAPPFHSKG